MRKITLDKLQRILDRHDKWLHNEPGGRCADLRNTDLSKSNLSRVNLNGANLAFANLGFSNLYAANLENANLAFANLERSDLHDARLNGANLAEANLCNANLTHADLDSANFRGSNLRNAWLAEAKNIDQACWGIDTAFYPLQCPESGSFIGYKKAHDLIIKLKICKDALRSSATTRKCRCSKAEVLGFESFSGKSIKDIKWVPSDYDPCFLYEIGKIVEVPNFDTNRWNECAPGIHFFLTREEAVKYTG